MTRTEFVDREVPVRVKVPGALLVPCPVTPMPVQGDTWQDAWVIMVQKDKEQRSCNERFGRIENWQEGDDDANE